MVEIISVLYGQPIVARMNNVPGDGLRIPDGGTKVLELYADPAKNEESFFNLAVRCQDVANENKGGTNE